MDPVVTVLIASYNCAEYLPDLVAALQAQTLSCWRAVIVDDASTQGDPEAVIARLREPRVRVLRHAVNRGAGAAFNTAFRASNTPLVMIHGGDDLLAPTYFEKTLPVLIDNQDVDAVFTDFQLFGDRELCWNYPIQPMELLSKRQWFPHMVLMRRALWERTEGHYEGDELRHGNVDWDFFLSIVESGPFRLHRVPEALYFYRQHHSNISLKRPYNEFITRECMYRRHKAWFDALDAGPRFIADGYLEAAEASWRRNEPARAADLAARAVRLCPPEQPSLPLLDATEKDAVRLLARYQILMDSARAEAGTEPLRFSQKMVDARLGMMACNFRLGRLAEARGHLEILLGAALGAGAASILPELLVLLALLCQKSGEPADVNDALALALRIAPGCRDATLLRARCMLDRGEQLPALRVACQCVAAGGREALEVLGMVAAAWKDLPDPEAFQQALAPPAPEEPQPSLLETAYAFPLGRRLYWAHRAKDLYETYGQTEGGFDALMKVVEIIRPRRVLEIGCGNGRNLALFSRLGIESVGQDISAAALELARARQLPHVTLTDLPVTELDYPDGHFDLVISNRVLQHIKEADARDILAAVAAMGTSLYLNELRPDDAAEESFYQYKHDYDALLGPLGMRHSDDIQGENIRARLFRRASPETAQ